MNRGEKAVRKRTPKPRRPIKTAHAEPHKTFSPIRAERSEAVSEQISRAKKEKSK
jgi:hypothetical protein